MLVASDMLTDKNYPALSKGKGDAFMILGATLYGFSKFPVFSGVLPVFNVPFSQRNRRVFR
jgi:hypothetical protein